MSKTGVKTSQRNIAIVQPELYYPRGAERQVCEVAHQLVKRGHKVTIYTFHYGKAFLFSDLLDGVTIVSLRKKYFPICDKEMHIFFRILFFFKIQLKNIFYSFLLARKIKKNHDVINAHNYPAHWISFWVDIPVVWTCNEPPYWHYYSQSLIGFLFFLPFNLVDKIFSNKVKKILVLDSRIKTIVKQAYQKPTTVIGSGAQLLRKRSKKEHAEFNVVFVGELHPQKRPLDLLQAMLLVKKDIPHVKLHIIGGGVLDSQLRKFAKQNDISVTFYGRADNKTLYSIYDISDVAIFVPENQPWGIFPLETLLAGIPTIISDECGVLDVLPKQAVTIIKTGNVDMLKESVFRVYKNYAKEVIRVKKYKKAIQMSVSWDAYAERFLAELA